MHLAERLPDGATLRQHLTAAASQTGHADPRLAARLPAGLEPLWTTFLDLHGSRQAGFGVSAIAPSEVLAWQRLRGVELTPWEVDTLAAVDRAVVAVMAEQQIKKAKH